MWDQRVNGGHNVKWRTGYEWEIEQFNNRKYRILQKYVGLYYLNDAMPAEANTEFLA